MSHAHEALDAQQRHHHTLEKPEPGAGAGPVNRHWVHDGILAPIPADHASSHRTEVLKPVRSFTGRSRHHETVGGWPYRDRCSIAAPRPPTAVLYNPIQAQVAASGNSDDKGVEPVGGGNVPLATNAYEGTIDGATVGSLAGGMPC